MIESYKSAYAQLRKRVLKRLPGIIHLGQRSLLRATRLYGQPVIEKCFDNTFDGQACFERELLAQRLFGNKPWMIPAVKRRSRTLAMSRYSDDQRLDKAVLGMDKAAKAEVARQAMNILWEIFEKGYAHRDFHPWNLFWIDGVLKVSDFETLEAYPPNEIPSFPANYDITGYGLQSPFNTSNVGYESTYPFGLQAILGISADQAIESVRHLLKEKLRKASLDFTTNQGHHRCKAERIYCSFTILNFAVKSIEAQRDSSRRLARFDLTAPLHDRSFLDLGCNVGGMLFETQKFNPSLSVGIEIDREKINIAQQVAKFAGLRNMHFEHADIDNLSYEFFQRPFDFVYCLAINKHVKNPKHLIELLGKLTGDRLFFEGNAGTNIELIAQQLLSAGFAEVRNLGLSDDEYLPENNVRPLLVAYKHRS